MSRKITIFVSYSHQDAKYVQELLGYLRDLEEEGAEFWWDERIATGELWDDEIKAKIAESDIALVLVSQAFLNSSYCKNVEIRRFLDQKKLIFPVILSACRWKRYKWLSKRQFLPGGDQNVAQHFRNHGERMHLYLQISEQLESWIKKLGKQGPPSSPQSPVAETIDRIQQPDWADAVGEDEYGRYADFSIKGVRQRMRWIEPGEFMMGSPDDEAERQDNEARHRVVLTQGFWLADTACTQALWQAMTGNNPSNFKGGEKPVEQVGWEDVQHFIERLNTIVPGQAFRLPTEAEWEYACRAGTQTPFSFGHQITPEQVNYNGNYPYTGGKEGLYREKTVEVKALPCNRWGLYQMHGNVCEWCQDWDGEYDLGIVEDPAGPDEGRHRVLRGGGWVADGGDARSARRLAGDPAFRLDVIGFRLARGQPSGQ